MTGLHYQPCASPRRSRSGPSRWAGCQRCAPSQMCRWHTAGLWRAIRSWFPWMLTGSTVPVRSLR